MAIRALYFSRHRQHMIPSNLTKNWYGTIVTMRVSRQLCPPDDIVSVAAGTTPIAISFLRVKCWDMWYVSLVVWNDLRFLVAYRLISMILLFLRRKYEFVPADIPIIERLKSAWIHKKANGVFTSDDLSTDASLKFKNRRRSWIMMLQSELLTVGGNEQTIISSFLIDLT